MNMCVLEEITQEIHSDYAYCLVELQKGVTWEIKNGISFVEEAESIGIA